MDVKKACDSVNRYAVWVALSEKSKQTYHRESKRVVRR